jgi:ATP-dependent exoDNAse (exonuclease V) alpha subunit
VTVSRCLTVKPPALNPKADEAQRHIDLAYAITAHGAQGASEPFAIALEGVEGRRKALVSFESAYVALSRMKQHAQVYTDNREDGPRRSAVLRKRPARMMCSNRRTPGR